PDTALGSVARHDASSASPCPHRKEVGIRTRVLKLIIDMSHRADSVHHTNREKTRPDNSSTIREESASDSHLL
ncbi:hypothetical protein AcV7_002168, partial [Taiwanofungus camphoratus]